MFESIKPGQTIRCTVVKEPRLQDDQQTVARLMRRDPTIKRQLTRAQSHRRRTLVVRSRGKRPWAVRRRTAKYAIPSLGATWTMRYTPEVAPDFRSISTYLKVEPA